MARVPITFLSDYGTRDPFAGICRAVIVRIEPAARVIDLTHGIEPGDVRTGAVALVDALPHAPAGIHLAIVDPGVGTERRAVAVRAADRTLVGPDNGLLAPAIEALGGAAEAVEISSSPFALEPVSATFHGRDVFAPVAARLAGGAVLREAGARLPVEELTPLELPRAEIAEGRLIASVVAVDRFGNLSLGAEPESLAEAGLAEAGALRVAAADRGESPDCPAVAGLTYAEAPPGGAVVHPDSAGRLAVALNGESAAARLAIGRGDRVRIAGEPEPVREPLR